MNDIIVGVDRSETARKAAESAAEIAAKCGTNLHLVTCVKGGDATADASAFLDQLSRQLDHDRVTSKVGLGDVAEILCEEATRLGARMIVVGNVRVQGVSRVLGSIALDVAKHAPCDVLIANTTS